MTYFQKIFIIISLFFLSGCKVQHNDDALIVGISADNPPYQFIQDNNIVGLEIDIINEIGKKLNKEIVIKNLEFNSLIAALESKNIDLIISGLSVTPERKEKVSFSQSYLTTSVAVLHRCTEPIYNIDDLKNKTIGYQLGTVWGNIVESLKDKLNVKPHSLSNNLMLVEELKSRTVDGVMLEEAQAKKFAHNNGEFTYFVLDSSYAQQFAIAMPLNSPLVEEVDKALKELEEEGKLKVIIHKWLP